MRSTFGANQWLVDELYEQFLADKNSVDPAWWDFFEDYRPRSEAPGREGGNGAPAAPHAEAAPSDRKSVV